MRKKQRNIILRIITVILVLIIASPGANVNAAVSISAASAVVMDCDTGEILYSKDMDSLRAPASMTKIMTAYIIFEEIEQGNLSLDTEIKISSTAAAMSRNNNYPMAVPLTAGASYTVDTLLELIMVPSASASCYAMAEHISGSEAAFVVRMNETAKRLGMNAAFKNCHGAQPHNTTARSIAILIRRFIQDYPEILNYTSLESVQFNGATYANTNKLLTSQYYYEGADGFKTGTIAEAGYCLATTAERDGRRIISVVMKSSSNDTRHTDSQKILDAGFEELARRDGARENAVIDLNAGPIRRNAEFYIPAVFQNVQSAFNASGGFTVDGEIVQTFDNLAVYNGTTIGLQYCLTDYAGETAKIGIFYYLPGGGKKEWTVDVPVSTQPPALYKDIHKHWAENIVVELSEAGLFSGNTEGYFKPDDGITLAQLVSVLGRVAESMDIEIPDAGTGQGAYYDKYIQWAGETGIIDTGTEDFAPEKMMDRKQAAFIIYNFMQYMEGDIAPAEKVDFNDIGQLEPITGNAITLLAGYGIISGYDDGGFQPDNTLKRAEFAAMVYQYLQFSFEAAA